MEGNIRAELQFEEKVKESCMSGEIGMNYGKGRKRTTGTRPRHIATMFGMAIPL